MKRVFSLLSIFLITLSLSMTAFDASAAKFGGSRSFGKSYRTAPSQPQSQPAYASKPTPGQSATSGARKGLMGGLLGGLLAGGLLAWMFGSGAFEGLQLMDILLFAGVAFVLFKLFKGMNPHKAPAMAHQTAHAYSGNPLSSTPPAPVAVPQAGSGTGFNEVPFNLPPGFDLQAFLNGAREHYRTLQQAWNGNDLAKIQEYVSPSLYNELVEERRNHAGEQHTEVMFVDAQLVRADHGTDWAQVSVKFSGQYRDTVEKVEEKIDEVWHLERDLRQANAPWLIVGITQ